MAANYVLIEKITVGANNATSVTFSSIPQTGYTDLVLKVSGRATASGFDKRLNILFNNNSSNYNARAIYGIGSSVASYSTTLAGYIGSVIGASGTANSFGNTEVYIPNYTSSNFKSYSVDNTNETNSANDNRMDLLAGLWSDTTAISSIVVNTNDGTALAAGSTFYLYGVAKLGTTPAISPYATGGDTIMTDGTYWYHTFTSSGTFTPQKALSCDYLVVAGGGGGGNTFGGAGAAGGLRSTVTATGGGGSLESALSLASGTGYTVTIGAGGAGATGRASKGASGSNSVFSTITSTGGGGGGSYDTKNGATGGSGGGGGGETGTGGSGTANQGYAGGSGLGGHGGGAGGAGGAGANGTVLGAGNGGVGVAVSITGSSVTYAGGGSGGSNNDGTTLGTVNGGGGQGQYGNGNAGTANLGGGGGGGGLTGGVDGNGGAGGSGIVIVRYLV